MQDMSGRSGLVKFASSNKYVFHGSAYNIVSLEPRQAYNAGKIDGAPAVCATTDVDQAIFRALINRSVDERAGRNHYSAWSRVDDAVHFLALKETYDDVVASGIIGYVYVLDRALFAPYRAEMRSNKVVFPEDVIEVSSVDLPKNLHLFESVNQLRSYHKDLKVRV